MNTSSPSRSTLRRQKFQAAGLCRECGKQPPLPNNTRCADCVLRSAQRKRTDNTVRTPAQRKRLNEQRRARRAAWVAAGICPDCGKRPAEFPAQRCRQCLAYVAARARGKPHNTPAQLRKQQQRRRKRRIAAGLCTACGRPIDRDGTRCNACAAKERQRQKNKRDRTKASAPGNRAYYRRLREQVFSHYTNGTFKCACPGCTTQGLQFLTLDHTQNDGHVHRRRVKSGIPLFRWCIDNNFPPSIQVLCWNCNTAKQYYGNGVCPHVGTASPATCSADGAAGRAAPSSA